MAGTEDPQVIRKSFIGPLSYLIGTGVAWFSTELAFMVYFITPVHRKGSDPAPGQRLPPIDFPKNQALTCRRNSG